MPGVVVRVATAACASLLALAPATAAEIERVRVGVYDNPPKVFLDDSGGAKGFWPALTRVIAERRGWRIEWVSGTWSQGLDRLADGRIDVMVDVGLTPARQARYRFGDETVHISWSRLYRRPGSTIETIPDLAGQRVAGLASSFNLDGPGGVRALLADFGIDAEVVEYPSYHEVFEALDTGQVDAAVTNRNFGNRVEDQYRVERTSLVFQPAELRYAFSGDSARGEALAAAFDAELATLKSGGDSAYYALLDQWLGPRSAETRLVIDLPAWAQGALAALALFALLTSVALLSLNARVRRQRSELAALLETRQSLINALPAHIALLDGEGVVVDVNDQWRHFGERNANPDPAFGIGSNYIAVCEAADGECGEEASRAAEGIRAVVSGDRESFALEYPCHPPDGERWFRLMATSLPHAERAGAGAVVMHVDITERKQAERRLSRLAYEDVLTGLPSRNGFVRDAEAMLQQAGCAMVATVVMLDVVGQRDINDLYGFEAGDQLLQEIGSRLRAELGDGAVVGRAGGDEFAVFLQAHDGGELAARRAGIERALARPFALDGGTVEVWARFGYTELRKDLCSVDAMLREAELALFGSREVEGVRWMAYSPDLDAASRHRIEITRELRRALRNGEFELHFQPKVDLDSNCLIAGEALIRWLHPERGLQSPGTFIPVAERSQLMVPIGEWVLREACRLLKEWQVLGLDIVRVAVNVSVVQFKVGDLADTLATTVAEQGIDPGALTLEITESVFEQESDLLLDQLRRIHALGVRLSLDDFGTGYSSLLYLQRYPFDEIKIDQGFVRHMLTDDYSYRIVTTVVGLAGALGADVVPEGIEGPEERDALMALGCRIGQGYYYSVPLAAEDFRWLLEKRATLPLDTGPGRA